MALVTGTTSAGATVQGYRKFTWSGAPPTSTTSNTDPINGYGYPWSSWTVKVVAGTVPTSVQAQGSNDGGLTWVNIGTALITFPNGAALGPPPFELYQWVIVTGGATGLYQIDAVFSTPRG